MLDAQRLEQLGVPLLPGHDAHGAHQRLIQRLAQLRDQRVHPHRVGDLALDGGRGAPFVALEFRRLILVQVDHIVVQVGKPHVEDADDADALGQIHLVELADVQLAVLAEADVPRQLGGRVEEEFAVEAESQAGGHAPAHNGLLLLQVEASLEFRVHEAGERAFAPRLDAIHDLRHARLLAELAHLNQRRRLYQRRRRHPMARQNLLNLRALKLVERLCHQRMNMQMGLPAHDALLDVPLKPQHHRVHNHQNRHAQRRPQNRQQRDERHKRPLRTQIAKRQKQLQRQMDALPC